MSRSPGARDPHERFQAWLRDGAAGDPPRDAALHGSVCPECSQSIEALDALTAIELANAGMPPMSSGMGMPLPFRGRMLSVPRLAGVGLGVVMAGTLVGLGAGQLLRGAPPTQEQSVLGATGFPGGTGVLAAPSEPEVSDSPTPTPSPTRSATPSPSPTSVAVQTQAPATPPPTAVPTATSTPEPKPTATERPTPRPTSSPTAQPTPPPTPTPSPTESAGPSPTAAGS